LMTSRRAVAYGSPVSAMRLRAAALILSCDIVPLLRWPRPGAWPPRIGDHDGRGKTPREGWAALVLGHYRQRRAGVARIRQTWLPSARIRQPDGHFHRPARAITRSPWLRWPADGAAGCFQSWRPGHSPRHHSLGIVSKCLTSQAKCVL